MLFNPVILEYVASPLALLITVQRKPSGSEPLRERLPVEPVRTISPLLSAALIVAGNAADREVTGVARNNVDNAEFAL